MPLDVPFYVITRPRSSGYTSIVHRTGCSFLRRAAHAKPKEHNPLDNDRFNHYRPCPRCKPLSSKESHANNKPDAVKGRAVTFAEIKRDGYFRYKEAVWKRTRGRWAIPVVLIGSGQGSVYFDLDTEVETVAETSHD